VADDCGTAAVSSNSAALTVTCTLAITVQPTDQSAAAGATVVFSLTAVGETPTYQWRKSTDGGTNYADIGGETANSYSHTALSGETTYKYKCVVSDACGTTPVTSNAATLTVTVPNFNDATIDAYAANLKGYWKFDEATGTGVRKDLIGTYDWTPAASITRIAGPVVGSYALQHGSYLVKSASKMFPVDSSKNWLLRLCFYHATGASTGGWMMSQEKSPGYAAPEVYLNNGTFRGIMVNSNGSKFQQRLKASVSYDAWHHVTLFWDASTKKLDGYFDGVQLTAEYDDAMGTMPTTDVSTVLMCRDYGGGAEGVCGEDIALLTYYEDIVPDTLAALDAAFYNSGTPKVCG